MALLIEQEVKRHSKEECSAEIIYIYRVIENPKSVISKWSNGNHNFFMGKGMPIDILSFLPPTVIAAGAISMQYIAN